MSNHFSADNIKFPGDDRRLDLTDLFVFTSSEDPDKTVLIIDSNPTSAPPPIPATATGPEFHPDAVHRINIDTDGDAKADIAFTFTFSEYADGMQTVTAWYATGGQARNPEPGLASSNREAPAMFADLLSQPRFPASFSVRIVSFLPPSVLRPRRSPTTRMSRSACSTT